MLGAVLGASLGIDLGVVLGACLGTFPRTWSGVHFRNIVEVSSDLGITVGRSTLNHREP